MELKGLLQAFVSTKPITVNLFDENNLLLITFDMPGFEALDDFLLDDDVLKIELINLYKINVQIDTSNNL